MSSIILAQKKIEPQRTINLTPSIGLVIPFYPRMNDDQKIDNILAYTIEEILQQLDSSNCPEAFKTEAVQKIKATFDQLNFHSERKAVAIIMTPYESKTIYLSFNAKPIIVVKEQISFFELVEPFEESPEFYYFILEKRNSVLYEYRNQNLYKIYEKLGKSSIKDVCAILNYTNNESLKPVFVQGPGFLTDEFASEYGQHKIIFKNPITENEKIGGKAFSIARIIEQWKYWYSQLSLARVRLFNRSDSLIHTKTKIIHALKTNTDGLLLIGKAKRKEICSKWMLDKKIQEMQSLFEKFLIRGNRVILVDDEPLRSYDHIVLLKQVPGNFIKKLFHWRDESGQFDFI